MLGKNSILSLISLVIFIALAAVSSYLYNGSPEKSAEINDQEIAGKMRTAIEFVWQASGGWLAGVSEVDQVADNLNVSENDNSGQSDFQTKLRDEWDKSSVGQPDIMAYIKEIVSKIKGSIESGLQKQ